ncbi:MAG: hypothetical protein KDD89_01525 [Anaerolineales bacterium]|nr:hypothetical protein [Anaerolineales bacterium]
MMNRKRIGLSAVLALFLLALLGGTAVAAEIVSQEIYRVPADTVIEDDLYISASEAYIEGTVKGDLLVSGAYLEINGTVEGDVFFVGLGLVSTGTIDGDLRGAAGGVDIHGRVAEDTLLFSWGDASLPFPLGVPNADLLPGVILRPESVFAQDVMLNGGSAVVEGRIEGDLQAQTNSLTLSGTVAGSAEVSAIQLNISDTAQVGGVLTYSAPQTLAVPETVASEVVFQPMTEVTNDAQQSLVALLLQLVSMLLGFALVGWALLRWSPRTLARPVQVLFDYPVRSAWLGFLVGIGFLVFPFATFLLASAVGLFWGVLPALVAAAFVVSGLLLVWIFSPLVTGMWIGLRFTRQPLNALLVGVLAMVLLMSLPLLGIFVSFVSFILTLGSLLLVWLSGSSATAGASETNQTV